MIIGVPKEIKDKEYRVALTPGGAESLVHEGHKVLVQRDAGVGSGYGDEQYEEIGACVLQTATEVYAQAEMILKVKEPLPSEYDLLRPRLLLFTYLHLAADGPLTRALTERQVTAVGYETVQLPNGSS
jgi:alanine dehydrogenase